MAEAWVNWNPEPEVHAFGAELGRRPLVVGLCGISVRERRGDFDPADPKACAFCAEAVRAGWTFEEARPHRPKHGPSPFSCGRPA